MAPGELLTTRRSAVSSDGHSTPGLVSGRQAPDAAGSGCRTSGSGPALMRSPSRLVGVQIDLLVFDTFPESFHKHVVAPAPFAVHADLNAVVSEQPRELVTGELAPLVGVEDLRAAILRDRLSHRIKAEVRGQRIGEPPGQHPATRPVQNGKKIHEAPAHRNVGDIGRPDLIGACDRHVAQEIGIDPVSWMPLRGAGLAIQRRDSHAPHEAGHTPPPDGLALLPQKITEHAGARKRILQMEFVNPAHEAEPPVGAGPRLVVGR